MKKYLGKFEQKFEIETDREIIRLGYEMGFGGK